MTLDSITKGLTKAWRTSTGLAIASLTGIILILSIATEVDLSDLATFGLFLVALQALDFTKEQVSEWRRKDALTHCYEAERLYEKIKPIVNDIIQAAFGSNAAKERLFSNRRSNDYHVESCNIENLETFNRLITEINMIYIHLSEMNKEPVRDMLGLLVSLDCAMHLVDMPGFECEEKEEELIHAEEQLREVKI